MSAEDQQDDLWAPLSPEEVKPEGKSSRPSRRERHAKKDDARVAETRSGRRAHKPDSTSLDDAPVEAVPHKPVTRRSAFPGGRATKAETVEQPVAKVGVTKTETAPPAQSNKRFAIAAGAGVLAAALGFGIYVLVDTYMANRSDDSIVTDVETPLEIGATGTASRDDTELAAFTLAGFGPTSCVDSEGQPFTPTKGRFVVLDFVIQTKDFDATGAEWDRWYIGDDRTPAVTNDTVACIPTSEPDLSPNSESTVQVVLDIPTEATTVSFESLNPLPISMSWVIPEGASFNPFTGDDGFGDE